MKIIALTGKKRHGKTTTADYLEQYFLSKGKTVERIPFKKALIAKMKIELKDTLEQLSELYQMSIETLFNVKPPVMRALMINYGTEIYRSKDVDYWAKEAEIAIKNSKADVVIVDDLRFKNEFNLMKHLNADIYRIVREGFEEANNATHISETDLDNLILPVIVAKDRTELLNKLKNLYENIN
jgi:hypothetical protein